MGDSLIYTTGYTKKGWTPETLLIEAKRLNAIVLDIRKSAKSWNSDWCYQNLSAHLTKRWYFWCPALGNRNYKDGPIEIDDPQKGIDTVEYILNKGSSVILLCACRSLHSCHRNVVAQMLVEWFNLESVEIDPPSEQLELF